MNWIDVMIMEDQGIDVLPLAGTNTRSGSLGGTDHMRSDTPVRDSQSVLRRLGLPPHTPPTLVLEAIGIVGTLVGQGVQLQQEAIKKTRLFDWLGEHVSASVNLISLATNLSDFTTSEKYAAEMESLAESA
jgi:hypothetical protein